MGDDATGSIVNKLASEGAKGLTKEESNNLENLSTNSKNFLDGINETKNIAQKQLNYVSDIAVDVGTKGWFAETLGQLVDNFEDNTVKEDESRVLSEEIKDILSDMKVFEETTSTDNKENKKKRGKVSDRTKLDDLKSLPYEFATLGAVLTNALTQKNDDKKNNKGGISGFFKGLLEGVGGIAALGVALLAFAGATLLFTFVDWGKAVIGLLAFTVFTIGMVGLAKLLGKEQKNLVEFAAASLILSGALGVFAVSLYIVSAVTSGDGVNIAGKQIVAPFDMKNAISGTLVFLGFLAGIAVISHIASKNNKSFVEFAKASLILSGALSVFAVSLYVVSTIVNSKPITINGKQITPAFDLSSAVQGTKIFLGFLLAIAVISRVASSDSENFSKFAATSLLMSASLIVFSFSLAIVSALYSSEEISIGEWKVPKVDIPGAIAGLGLFLGFILAYTAVGLLASNSIGAIAGFTGVSVLMSASLVAFSVAMAVTAGVVSGEGVSFGDIKFQPPKDVVKNALIGLASMSGFMLAFIALGSLFLIPFAGQAMLAGLAMASASMIAISVSTIAFAKAMSIAGLAITGGEAEIDGRKYNLKPYDGESVNKMFSIMENFITSFAKITDQIGIKGAIIVSILGKSIMPIITAMDKMVSVVIKASENYDNIIKIVNGDSNMLDHLMDPVMYVILGHDLKGDGGLMGVANNMSKHSAKVLKLVGDAIVPITDAMLNMINVVIKAAENKEHIETLMNTQGGMQMLDHLLDPVIWMILGSDKKGNSGLMGVANNMSKKSTKILKLVVESMGPMIDSMDKMLDVVFKAATLGTEGLSVDELVKTSMKNLDLILNGKPKGTGFIPMFVSTANKLKDTSKKAIEAIKTMPTIIQALGDLVGVIAKSGDLERSKIDAGIYGLSASSEFLRTFIKTIADIIPGGVGGFFSSMFEGNPIDKIKEAHEYLKQGGVFYNVFQDLANIAKTFDGKGFENLGKVAIVGSFTTDMLKGSDNFKDIMKNIQKGIDNLSKPQSLTTIGNAIDTISKAGDISNKFDPIYKLIERSTALHSAAEDLASIASSYDRIATAEKMGDMSNKSNGVFNLKSSSKNDGKQTTQGDKKIQNTGKMTVEDILNDWYENGVKIKQKFDGLPEEPKPVNLLSID